VGFVFTLGALPVAALQVSAEAVFYLFSLFIILFADKFSAKLKAFHRIFVSRWSRGAHTHSLYVVQWEDIIEG